MELEFEAEVIEWRGPAPFVYARLPEAAAVAITRVKKAVTYGWGVIPVEATIAGVSFATSLFPREGTYLLPLKDRVRRAVGVTVGDVVAVAMQVGRAPREPDL
ncbi:MAG: DUF1905 domain-containing protein [Devosia sp.]